MRGGGKVRGIAPSPLRPATESDPGHTLADGSGNMN